MAQRLALIQGHPDPGGNRLCHALADAYAGGAALAGHAVMRVEVARVEFPTCAHSRISNMALCPTAWSRRAT